MEYRYKFQNPAYTHEERADDLLKHLTLDEKIGMVTSNMSEVPRLGIKPCHFGVEIARGLVQRDQKRESTILPQPWGMAATFDDELMEKLGDMAGDEVRISNQMTPSSSLELFGPTVDMERDPRWGRNEEAYGEDPCLAGKMSAAYTRGLRGYDEKYIKTAPLLKHFYANNYEQERVTTNSNITPRMKYEYYLKAFEPAITEGGAVGLMTAYNLINGIEGVNNPDVTEICKKQWGMVFALSDGGDFGQNVADHRSYEDHAHSIADILGVGADLMLDSRDMVDPAVREALEKGLLTEEKLDAAIRDMLRIRFMVGDFDEDNPYANMDKSKLASSEHKALAVKSAEESMILLENDGMLPLKDDGKITMAVVGPLSNENYTCWYCGYAENQTPVLKGFREKLGEERVSFDEGFDHVAIKSKKTGKYLRANESGTIFADADLKNADLFELNDWDYGSWTLRSLKTGKYITENRGFEAFSDQEKGDKPVEKVLRDIPMCCVADEAFGWFVMELIKAEQEKGITYLKSWQNRALIIDEDGMLVSNSKPQNTGADEFVVEVASKGSDRVRALAEKADYTIVCGGNHPLINAREEYDRPDINLPSSQSELLRAAVSANKNTVLYLVTGYPFAIVEEKELPRAVLCSTHLGPSLGHVAASTVFGENNPAGRTPTTWYRSVRDLPEITDYDILKNNMTYMYFDGKPLYPFGYGLSYSSFEYEDVKTDKNSYGTGDTVNITLTIKNTGGFDGDEVVQLYVTPPSSPFKRPIKQLKAFNRIKVEKGGSSEAKLSFKVSELAFWCTEKGNYVVDSGNYILSIGASSEDIREKINIVVEGEPIKGRDGGIRTEAIDSEDYLGVEFLTDKTDMCSYAEVKGFRSYLVYPGYDIRGLDAFEGYLSSTAGSMDITLSDNDTGEILGRAQRIGTGSLTRFVPVVFDVSQRNDLVNLRITFNKQTSFKSFRFFKK